MWSRVLGAEHPDVILALSNLAKQHQHQEQYEEADSLLTKSQTSLQQLQEHPPDLTRGVEKALVALYEAWNRPAKAAPFRPER